MPRKSYMPHTVDGIGKMLTAFSANIGPLATKYNVSTDDQARVAQASAVWGWFGSMLLAAREWAQSLTSERDTMSTAPLSGFTALPGGPVLPTPPNQPGVTPVAVCQLDPGFFTWFGKLVGRIKDHTGYLEADGILLGIEGAELPPPDPATVPVVHGETLTGGHPEISCPKSVFQGYDVLLTRPGQAQRNIGFSTSRRFNVTEPLPAPGTAEVWTFVVQYRYQNAPFGQMSQPLNLTVRG